MYRGEESDRADEEWFESLYYGLQNGINVVDTAQKYRNGRSEKVIGNVLDKLFYEKDKTREDFFITTKAGLLSEKILSSNILKKIGIDESSINFDQKFCLEPEYIDWSVERALENLNLKYIDSFLLHNPEILFHFDNGNEKLFECFKILEKKCEQGKIKSYGLASWNGFRRKPESRYYIDLVSILEQNRNRLGQGNHLKIIEAPLSIGMPSILKYISKNENNFSFQDIIKKYDLVFFSSASLYEGHINELFELNKIFSYAFDVDSPNEDSAAKVSFPLSENSLVQLFELLSSLKKNKINIYEELNKINPSNINIFSKALDIVRSTQFVSSALVGMEKIEFVKDNIKILKSPFLNNKVIEKHWSMSLTT